MQIPPVRQTKKCCVTGDFSYRKHLALRDGTFFCVRTEGRNVEFGLLTATVQLLNCRTKPCEMFALPVIVLVSRVNRCWLCEVGVLEGHVRAENGPAVRSVFAQNARCHSTAERYLLIEFNCSIIGMVGKWPRFTKRQSFLRRTNIHEELRVCWQLLGGKQT